MVDVTGIMEEENEDEIELGVAEKPKDIDSEVAFDINDENN